MKRKVAIGFILFHFLIMTTWTLRKDLNFGRGIRSLHTYYVTRLLLWHGWSLFAPEPPMQYVHMHSLALVGDGNVLRDPVLVQPTANWIERYRLARLIKYKHGIVKSSSKLAWRDLCRYVAGTVPSDSRQLELQLSRFRRPLARADETMDQRTVECEL